MEIDENGTNKTFNLLTKQRLTRLNKDMIYPDPYREIKRKTDATKAHMAMDTISNY